MDMLAAASWFVLEDDARGRWVLDYLQDAQGSRIPEAMEPGRRLPQGMLLRCPVLSSRGGLPVDFTFTPGGIPVVSVELAARVARVAGRDVRLVPVEVIGARGHFVALDVIAAPRCLDGRASRGLDADGRMVSLAEGSPIVPVHLVLREEATEGHRVLRPAELPRALVVHGLVRDLLERERTTGVRLTPLGST
ncbi:MAG: hypothetical protein H6732_07445 [Alphaproteobacteria bacterium]|nr:hypothetical protein [Alphaproteobacteria bacterium]